MVAADGTGAGGRIEPVTPFTMEPQLLRFRPRLRAAMVAAGYQADTLAKATGVKRDTVYSYLRGQRVASTMQLLRLSRALGVSCDWLLGFDVEPIQAPRGSLTSGRTNVTAHGRGEMGTSGRADVAMG